MIIIIIILITITIIIININININIFWNLRLKRFTLPGKLPLGSKQQVPKGAKGVLTFESLNCQNFCNSPLSFTRASPGIAMSMILASFACLSWTKMMSSPVASTILSHCLLKSHRTLNPVQIFYHFLWGMHNCTTDLPIPVLSSHTVANAHTTPHCLVSSSCPQAGLTCTFTLLGDLITLSPFFPHFLHIGDSEDSLWAGTKTPSFFRIFCGVEC